MLAKQALRIVAILSVGITPAAVGSAMVAGAANATSHTSVSVAGSAGDGTATPAGTEPNTPWE